MKTKAKILFTLLALSILAGCSSVPETKTSQIDKFPCKDGTALGVWDDIFCSEDFPILVMRRESDIFLLDPDNSRQPVFIATFKGINDAEFVSGICTDNKTWVFCNSKSRGPLAINLTDKKLIILDPPLPLIGFLWDTPFIKSWVYSLPNKSVFLGICRSNSIWLSLENDNWHDLPSDWSLYYFSANMDTAVFQHPTSIFFSEYTLVGMEMKTGKETANFPARNFHPRVPYSWQYKYRAKFVEENTKDRGDCIVGVSFDGKFYLQDFQMEDSYPRKAVVKENWLLYLFSWSQDYSLWFAPAQNEIRPELIDENVKDAFILGSGQCVYSISSMEDYDSNKNIMDVFVYDGRKNIKWNVLEGEPELPLLKPNIRKHSYIRDSRKVSLINGFGKGKKQLVLIRFRHLQSDDRSFPVMPDFSLGETIPRTFWFKDLIVSADGIQFSGQLPQLHKANVKSIWLHNSGKVFFTTGSFVNGQLKQALQMKKISFNRSNPLGNKK